MPGEDHRRDLVAKLLMAEARAGLGVARGGEQVEQIARMVLRRLPLPCVYDAVHEAEPFRAEGGAADVERRGERERQQQVEEARACVIQSVAQDQGPQLGAELGHLQREHGLARDGEREGLEVRQQLDGTPDRLGQLRFLGFARPDDVARQDGHGARRERRGNGAALMAPSLALREEKTVAEERLQHAPRAAVAAVIVVVGDEHVTDRVRRIDHELPATEEAAG